jgi:hypothetical protein
MLFIIRVSVVLLLLATPSLALADFHNALSLQGFTGLLNTPNAATTGEGDLYFAYSNQKEPQWRTRTKQQDNVMMSLGLFDLLEIGGRFFEAPRVGRDLSGNFKVRVPFIPQGYYLPQLAFGIQDLGGGSRARFLQTKYAVASEELWRFRFSVGYGTGPDRMKGVFGGVELKACDWVYLLAEHDTKEKNVGLRLVTPQIMGYPVHLQATVKSSLDHDPSHPEYAVGIEVPLGLNHNYTKAIPSPRLQEGAATAPQAQKQSGAAPPPPPGKNVQGAPEERTSQGEEQTPAAHRPQGGQAPAAQEPVPAQMPTAAQQERILKRLANDGFQNVRVGSSDKLLVVEYENARYNHNELDAMGVVTGIVQLEAPPQFETLRVIEKKKGIRILQLEMPLKELRAFFSDAANKQRLQDALKITPDITDSADIKFVAGDGNSSYLTTQLLLYPGLTTYIGTEVGAFDYLLSLKPDLYVNLWKGGALNARADIPLSWSRNYNDGKRFRAERHESRLDRLMLFQAVKPSSTVLAVLGAGYVLPDSYGTANELLWTPGNGNHQFKFSQVYTRGDNGGDREEYLGSYRYYFSPLDLYLQGTGGKFLTRDRGITAELKRFFGDTAVSVFYKTSVATDGRNHQAGGIQFDLPLTPRRDMKPYVAQVRGTDDWSFAQETAIAKKGSLNYLGTPIGLRLEPPFSGNRLFYNRDRLSEEYIKEHLLRLRDAYQRYVVEE